MAQDQVRWQGAAADGDGSRLPDILIGRRTSEADAPTLPPAASAGPADSLPRGSAGGPSCDCPCPYGAKPLNAGAANSSAIATIVKKASGWRRRLLGHIALSCVRCA